MGLAGRGRWGHRDYRARRRDGAVAQALLPRPAGPADDLRDGARRRGGASRSDLVRPLVDEAAAAAGTAGVTIDADAIEARLRSLPGEMQSSMLKDALARRAVELDAIAGPIIGALGRDGARATVQAVRASWRPPPEPSQRFHGHRDAPVWFTAVACPRALRSTPRKRVGATPPWVQIPTATAIHPCETPVGPLESAGVLDAQT